MSQFNEDVVQGEVVYDLPYRLVPEIGQESEVSYAPPVFEKYLKLLTPSRLLAIIVVWSLIFLYFDSKLSVYERVGFISTFLYNGLSYVFIRAAMTPRKVPRVVAGCVGAFFMFTLHTGLNTFIMLALLITAVLKSYYAEKSLPKFSYGTDQATASLASVAECEIPVWGVAGGNISAASKFGEKAEVGAKGEAIVGAALKTLTEEYPFVRVFNGVKFVPGSQETWDIDHVVLIGNSVYFIDEIGRAHV